MTISFKCHSFKVSTFLRIPNTKNCNGNYLNCLHLKSGSLFMGCNQPYTTTYTLEAIQAKNEWRNESMDRTIC